MNVRLLRRLMAVSWIGLSIAACRPEASSPTEASPTVAVDSTGILLVAVGEQVQPAPATEELKQAVSDAFELALVNGDDLGYPWFDPSTGELVLSAVTPRGRQLIEDAGITVPRRIREVAHGAGELQRIQDDVTFLRTRGVPGSEFLYGTGPDQRDNRTLLTISQLSRPLVEYLAAHYPVDTLAIRVDPSIAP